MEPALQRRVQRYGWDRASAYYENFWQQNLKPAHDLLMGLANLKEGEHVIDIAAGTGLVSFRTAEKIGTKGTVLATDISDKMVEIGNRLAAEKNYFNTRFERMDAEELTAPGNSFDVALCALGLMYVPYPVKALKEMYRVLKPGGRAVAAVWGQRKNCGWAEIFEIVDRRVASEVCPLFFNLGNPGMLDLNFTKAGFSSVHSERISTQLFYASGEDACGAAFAGGPVAMAYHKFSESVKEEVHKEYLDSIHQWRNGTGYAIPGEFVVGVGEKN
jgi:ubiquinone/menaquinone biosynthesis C-methylase UbiE